VYVAALPLVASVSSASLGIPDPRFARGFTPGW
jgi:hypothetical protein